MIDGHRYLRQVEARGVKRQAQDVIYVDAYFHVMENHAKNGSVSSQVLMFFVTVEDFGYLTVKTRC